MDIMLTGGVTSHRPIIRTVWLKIPPSPDELLRILLSTLIAKIRHRLLLVTLLIPIGFFLVSLGEGDTRCLGPSKSLPLFPMVLATNLCIWAVWSARVGGGMGGVPFWLVAPVYK
eukprot:1018124-Pelagomonas_calceolata.AAC.3